ncbi:MAG: lipoate--protein ligase [Bacillota bacterium]
MKDIIKGNIYISSATNPWYNQAFEEMLFNNITAGQIMLYLWQNQRTVVIGRHQNAWKECDWQSLAHDGGYLARRISGGGAVYHDLGNLNFTFVMKSHDYNLAHQVSIILQAVRNLGIEASFCGRNDLQVDGRKFSGNAYCHKKGNSLHHGTLLFDSDYGRLNHYLRPSTEKMRAKGVRSVSSRVVNLKEVAPEIDLVKLRDSICAVFSATYQNVDCQVVDTTTAACTELYEKYASWQWRFGSSPKFSVSYYRRFLWGEAELCFTNSQGVIEKATIYSDAMDGDFIEILAQSLPGLPFVAEEIIAQWRPWAGNPQQREIINDLSFLIKEKLQ